MDERFWSNGEELRDEVEVHIIDGFHTDTLIVHFTVVCLVAKPLNRSEAKDDLVMIQT